MPFEVSHSTIQLTNVDYSYQQDAHVWPAQSQATSIGPISVGGKGAEENWCCWLQSSSSNSPHSRRAINTTVKNAPLHYLLVEICLLDELIRRWASLAIMLPTPNAAVLSTRRPDIFVHSLLRPQPSIYPIHPVTQINRTYYCLIQRKNILYTGESVHSVNGYPRSFRNVSRSSFSPGGH